MGYWTTARDGTSFALDLHADGTPMTWGDGPADLMDDALRQIIDVFKEDIGRPPSIEELIAGLRFSTFALEAGDFTDPAAAAGKGN